ncbi:hypothetical protein Are01nite_42270 [Actinoplanes regularis]|nr:hypothetical protein Are01nite_42270 [Actinoplanes regularis]
MAPLAGPGKPLVARPADPLGPAPGEAGPASGGGQDRKPLPGTESPPVGSTGGHDRGPSSVAERFPAGFGSGQGVGVDDAPGAAGDDGAACAPRPGIAGPAVVFGSSGGRRDGSTMGSGVRPLEPLPLTAPGSPFNSGSACRPRLRPV